MRTRAYALCILVPDVKLCPGCGELKVADAYRFDSRRRDGIAHFCKECSRRWASRDARRHLDALPYVRASLAVIESDASLLEFHETNKT